MTRRRWRQMPDGSLVEVDLSDRGTSRQSTDSALWGDRNYEGMRTTDGVDISSRTKHREYMKATGLTTFDDYKSTFEQAQKAREQYRQGASGSVSRDDIARVVHRMFNK